MDYIIRWVVYENGKVVQEKLYATDTPHLWHTAPSCCMQTFSDDMIFEDQAAALQKSLEMLQYAKDTCIETLSKLHKQYLTNTKTLCQLSE